MRERAIAGRRQRAACGEREPADRGTRPDHRPHNGLAVALFGSKEELFTRALTVTVEDPPSDDADEAREILLGSLDAKLCGLPETTLIMMRSTLTHPDASELARSLLDKQISRVGNAITGSDSRLRAALVMSSILGLTIEHELLGIEDLRQATAEQIIDLLRPSLRILLSEDA